MLPALAELLIAEASRYSQIWLTSHLARPELATLIEAKRSFSLYQLSMVETKVEAGVSSLYLHFPCLQCYSFFGSHQRRNRMIFAGICLWRLLAHLIHAQFIVASFCWKDNL